MPEIAAPLARRIARAAELVHLFGHGVGGRTGERLMKRIGMPTSDDTILRHLKRRAREPRPETSVRVVGIDDWAWRKVSTYGTIVVDLERREVIDLLPDRSADGMAGWLKQHSEVEIISRDRCGSFAQGAHEGAPQARQVADRFHILQNLREAIEAQLSRAAESSARSLLPADAGSGPDAAWRRKEHRRDCSADGFRPPHDCQMVQADALPQRNAAAPKTTSPKYFEEYLSRRWFEGCVRGRHLFQEIKGRGYPRRRSPRRLRRRTPSPAVRHGGYASHCRFPRPPGDRALG